MTKGFHYIRLPQFFVPANRPLPTEEQLEGMVRPLNFCPTCHYVLCSCGNCHNSELCNEVCLHEEQEGSDA
jgi:hypothetical protein